MNKHHKKPGDTWEKDVKGVIYLMQAQPKGKAKAIRRITPYVMPQKANSLSGIPETKDVPKFSRKKALKSDEVQFPLNRNKGVTAKPFNPTTHERVKLAKGIWKEVKK